MSFIIITSNFFLIDNNDSFIETKFDLKYLVCIANRLYKSKIFTLPLIFYILLILN